MADENTQAVIVSRHFYSHPGAAASEFKTSAPIINGCSADEPQRQKWAGPIALPKMPVPNMGWLAYIKDPDGNVLGLLQPDDKAA